jgi:FKBP-type peptidyl-prolyl cis-trans isomerase FklB
MSSQDAMKEFNSRLEAQKSANQERLYGKNKEEGAAFLAENKTKEGVVELPSGLQYKVITMGTGEKPKPTSKVKVNYVGRLIDGTEFDSSYKRKEPTSFKCNQVIKGWTEALCLMTEGSTWELYIPYNLAYGERAAGKIPPFSTLIFTVELLEIEDATAAKPAATTVKPAAAKPAAATAKPATTVKAKK